MKALWKRFLLNKYLYGGVFLVGVLVIYFLFFRTSGVKLETMVVHRGDFVQQVSVSGTVVAAQNVELGFTQGGRVSRVYVKVGDRVAAGQTLAEIENGDLRAAVLQRQAALETQQAKLVSLQTGARPETTAVAQSQVASAQNTLDQANQALINAIRDAYSRSDDAVHNQVDQFMINGKTSNPQLMFQTADSQLKITLESERPTIEQVLQQWQATNATMTTTSDLTSIEGTVQKNLASISALLTDSSAALSRAFTSQSASTANISQWSTNITAARSNVDAAIAALTTAISAQKSAAAALDTAKKNLTLTNAGATSADLAAQQAQVKAAQADIESAQAQLYKTMVVAPFAGVITKMDSKVGSISSPNTSTIEMISQGTFQIESYVPEVDIANVAVGNSATTTLDAYGTDTTFTAKVVSIDPAETVRDAVPTYKTILQFVTPDSRIRSGMTANVLITTAHKADVLAVPQGAVVEKSGKKIITLLVGTTQVDRVVEVGSVSSLGQVEVTSGLQDSDVIVLPPVSI